MVVERIRLDGKNAIVCGAGGGGIGTATSKTLAEAGANIVAVDIDGARVGETVAQVRELGVQALGVVANVETKAGADEVVAEAERAFGEIHCLANIIGGMTSASEWNDLFNYGEAEWDAVFSRNLKYQFLIIQAVANHMRRKGIAGSIASLSSVSGWGGAPLHGAYGAAKAGVMALSRDDGRRVRRLRDPGEQPGAGVGDHAAHDGGDDGGGAQQASGGHDADPPRARPDGDRVGVAVSAIGPFERGVGTYAGR